MFGLIVPRTFVLLFGILATWRYGKERCFWLSGWWCLYWQLAVTLTVIWMLSGNLGNINMPMVPWNGRIAFSIIFRKAAFLPSVCWKMVAIKRFLGIILWKEIKFLLFCCLKVWMTKIMRSIRGGKMENGRLQWKNWLLHLCAWNVGALVIYSVNIEYNLRYWDGNY